MITLPPPGGDVHPWVASAGDTTGLLYARAATFTRTMQFSGDTASRGRFPRIAALMANDHPCAASSHSERQTR